MSANRILLASLLLAAILPVRADGRPSFGRPSMNAFRAPWHGLAPADWRPDFGLEPGQGRRVLEFAPDEPTSALFVAVAGTVEFERVDYGLDDGVTRSLDAFGAVRGPGLYQVADLDATRQVLWVRVVARALSRRSEVGLRLALR